MNRRMNILKEVRIKKGDYVLDYGCGPEATSTRGINLVGK